MNYIVIDLEWNQQSTNLKLDLEDCPAFEIIEIGAIKLNENFKICESFDRYIRPSIYPKMNPHTRKIINIDENKLKYADFFEDVFEEFIEWCGNDYIFCTWGSMDLTELQRNVKFYDLDNPFCFPLKYLDIQEIFSIKYGKRDKRFSLEAAIELCEISKNATFHNAINDAKYTALIMQKIGMKKYVSCFAIDYFRVPRTREEEIYYEYDNVSHFISMKYVNKTELLQDPVVVQEKCCFCKNELSTKIEWFASSPRTYYYVGKCEEHGMIYGCISIRRHEANWCYALREMGSANKKKIAYIEKKKK